MAGHDGDVDEDWYLVNNILSTYQTYWYFPSLLVSVVDMTTFALLLSWTTTPDMAGVTEPPTKSPFVATICSAAAGHPSTIQTLKPLQKIADLVTITGLCEKNYLARAT